MLTTEKLNSMERECSGFKVREIHVDSHNKVFPAVLTIFSIFSILFSMSTISAFSPEEIGGQMYYIIAAFLFVVVTINEVVKDKIFLDYFYRRNFKGGSIIRVITLSVSMVLSVYGLWKLFGADLNTILASDQKLTEMRASMDKTDGKLRQLSALEMGDMTLGDMNIDIYPWSDLHALSGNDKLYKAKVLEVKKQMERSKASAERSIEKRESELRTEFETEVDKKKNFSYMMIAICVIVEGLIIYICKLIGDESHAIDRQLEEKRKYDKEYEEWVMEQPEVQMYYQYKSMLASIYRFNKMNDSVLMGTLVKNMDKKSGEKFLDFLKQLKIIQKEPRSKYAVIVTGKEKANKLLEDYFQNILSNL